MKAITIEVVETKPYHKAASFINRIQNRDEQTSFVASTINSNIIAWGEQIHQEQLRQASQALSDFGFDPETGTLRPGENLPESITNPVVPENERNRAAEEYTKVLKEYLKAHPEAPINMEEVLANLECPSNSLLMMIDDVGVKRQKEERSVNGKKGFKSAQTVNHTVTWLRAPEGTYAIEAENTRQGLLTSLGFMMKNHLLENRELTIFYDGAKTIRSNVEEIFKFHKPLRLYLDWYHVCRRIKENLSMGLKCGKENRDENQKYVREILNRLWSDKVDEAIEIVESIPADMIRRKGKVQETIRYLEDRRPYLYNFAARKIVGLINSSNRVEDMNNQLVAKRQKNKSMSWSAPGSRGLATVTALSVNDEIAEWLINGTVRFSPKPAPCVKQESYSAAI